SGLARGEFAAALPLLRSASGRLVTLAQTIARRVEREWIEARLTELRSQATEKSQALAALGAAALETADSRQLLASLASAESQAAGGDLAAAIRILEVSLSDFDRVIDTARAELERARDRGEAREPPGRASGSAPPQGDQEVARIRRRGTGARRRKRSRTPSRRARIVGGRPARRCGDTAGRQTEGG